MVSKYFERSASTTSVFPLPTSWLRYQHPPDWLGPIRPLLQLSLQVPEPPFLPVLRHLLEGLPVHSGCALVHLRLLERLRQDIPPMDLVVQSVEPERRLRFGLRVELPSQLFEFCLGC